MNLRYTLRARKFRTKWDPAEIEWIMDNVGTGRVVFDIGAHKGGWTYWLRKAVGKSGKIFAFEPQPVLHDYLGKLFASRYWSNVTLESIALSNADDSAQIFIPGKSGSTSPGASLKQDILNHETDVYSIKVSTTTLDHYCDKASIDTVDFIKVDVEGSELDVLEGAEGALQNHHASWIIESEARHIGEDGVLKLFSTMEAAGYEGYFFSSAQLTPISEFSFTQHQRQDTERFWNHPDYCNNFLFTRNS
jgi:FkbM family methyltransferase